jgi:hypothetical protein
MTAESGASTAGQLGQQPQFYNYFGCILQNDLADFFISSEMINLQSCRLFYAPRAQISTMSLEA